MAIVQQYPLKTPKNSDLLVGTSIPDPNTNDDPKTSSFSVSSIGSFLITENNIITGGGTLNTIPLFTPDGQRIDDSIITQNALGTTITVNGGLTVDGSTTLNGALTVDDVATFTDEVECNNNVTVQGIFAADGNSVFSGGVTINDQLIDGEASTGTTGQILSSTGSSTVWIDAPSDPDAVVNTPDTYLSPKVRYIVSLTQGEYDAIVTPDANTLYIII